MTTPIKPESSEQPPYRLASSRLPTDGLAGYAERIRRPAELAGQEVSVAV